MVGRFFANCRSEARALILPDATADRRLVENLEEQSAGGPVGVAVRQPAPQPVEEIEGRLRIGDLQRPQLVARMQIQTDAESKSDQCINGAAELAQITASAVGSAEHLQQPLWCDRQADMR